MRLNTGDIVEGRITGTAPFGAFVELEGGGSGMIHISEVSRGYVSNIGEVLTVGQNVRAVVIAVNGEKVSLSLRRLEQPAPPAKPKSSAPRVWQGSKSGEPQSFEDMMRRFKSVSEDKQSDLKRGESGRSRPRRGTGKK